MYLFTRQTRLLPNHFRDGMEWAVGLTEKVNQVTSLNVGLWLKVMSPGPGTLSWGAAVESLVDLEDANAKMMVDDMLMETANRGAELTIGPFEDETAQFIHNAVDPNANPTYVVAVRSQLANGHFQRGVEAGIEIAQRSTALGGIPTSFLLGTTGSFGAVGWISSAGSLKQLEEAEQKVNLNPEFVAFLDEQASPCYLPGITTQEIWQRVV